MVERYYIRTGYQSNEQVLTFKGDEARTYWTNERIRAAASCQYYVYEKCLSLVQSKGYDSLLDVGCGPPEKVKWLLAPYCTDIVLIDKPSLAQLVKQILPHGRFIPANLEHIDFDLSKKFDLIICADVLEHLLNPDKCVRFIKRHLSQNGLAVFSTPDRDYLRGKESNYSPKPEHVREWNGAEFAQYITSWGFEVVERFWFPQIKLTRIDFLCSRLLPRLVQSGQQRRRWYSCQVLVCR